MENVKNYKCPCCAAPLIFDAGTQNMHCDSCGNDYPVQTVLELYETEGADGDIRYDWEDYTERSFSDTEAETLASYTCPSCGAEITGDDSLGATVCPYCGNSTIIKKRFEGSLRPDLIIPFKVDKKKAAECFEKACAALPFLPDEYRDSKKIEEMTGIYLPFWLYDCDCNAEMRYRAKRISTWSDARNIYTKTSHFMLIRRGSLEFKGVPADASRKAEDKYMDALEPFAYSDAKDFDTAFLSGYLADKYDVNADECRVRANERMKLSAENALDGTTSGFTDVQRESEKISYSGGKLRYALLPVWMLNIKYNGENFRYAVNGQTGKVAGKFPICKKKRLKCFLLSFLASFGICAAIAAAILFL